MRRLAGPLTLVLGLPLAAGIASAQDPEKATPKPVFELLDLVKRGLEEQQEENQRRVDLFLQKKEDQQRLLEEARATLTAEESVRDRKSTRLNSSHSQQSRMPSSA